MPPPVAGHQRGLAEEWELANDEFVPATFVSLRKEAQAFIGYQAYGVPGAVGKTVFHPEAGCQVPVQYAHCRDCLVPHCTFKNRFMLIDGDDGMRIVTEHTSVHSHGV